MKQGPDCVCLQIHCCLILNEPSKLSPATAILGKCTFSVCETPIEPRNIQITAHKTSQFLAYLFWVVALSHKTHFDVIFDE